MPLVSGEGSSEANSGMFRSFHDLGKDTMIKLLVSIHVQKCFFAPAVFDPQLGQIAFLAFNMYRVRSE